MSEILQPTEHIANSSAKTEGSLAPLDEQQINSLMLSRKQALETIKNEISRKVYFQIEEKIGREETQLKEILDWQQGKQMQRAKYSLILDPHYFEQEFLQN
jgi:hypothetical protein